MNDFDLLAEMELEEEGQRLRRDEMVRNGEITLMPFGAHRGKRIDMIPEHYLLWAIQECESMSTTLRRAIVKHLRSLPNSE